MMFRKRKGIEYTIEQMMVLALAGILAVSFTFILPGQVTRLKPAIEQKDQENNALILANVIQANQNLIVASGSINYKGIFDSSKLNVNMIEKSSTYDNITSCHDAPTALCKGSSSANAFILVLISDTENGKGWFSISKSGTDKFIQQMSCLKEFNKGNPVMNQLFIQDSNLGSLLKLKDCGFTFYSNILNHGMPVTIQYPDGSRHLGIMKLMIVQQAVGT